MYDINFFRNTLPLKRTILNDPESVTPGEVEAEFEKIRNKTPHIFNIETTNVCNMSCIMCPRPKLMTRKVRHMDHELFLKLVEQIGPHEAEDLLRFRETIAAEYGITAEERSENAFYFYTIAQHVILHGYGEPLLDPRVVERVQAMTDRAIPTYFSCVPPNIRMDRMAQLFDAGLGTIKFSMESLDPEEQKRVRGEHYDLERSLGMIREVLEYKQNHPEVDTNLVITLIAMSDSDAALAEHLRFIDYWKDSPVYAYVKSQDNRWFYAEDDTKNRSHYATQYCEFAWTSLSVMSGGQVVPCTQDFDAEMTLGDANTQTLSEIWNGESYRAFRHAHATGEGIERYKCHNRCDLPKLYQRLALG
ncbi:MAG: radical SAM/SPASM domain-containing protein [Desulfovibrionaceae bacterium]